MLQKLIGIATGNNNASALIAVEVSKTYWTIKVKNYAMQDIGLIPPIEECNTFDLNSITFDLQ